ncbi:MAG TPA: hypothetical protein VGW58_13340, partial [Pyrinomonadaceae bacterium]|nr:hypothetical protein [Pyrinomonadaceae bacterium]
INVNSYIPRRPPGRTMRVASSHQLAEAIQQAQDDPNTTSVNVFGGGSIQRPVIIKKYTTFDNSTYSCDVKPENTIFRDVSVTDYGCFLVADGVYVGGTYRPPQTVLDYFKSGNGRNPNDRYLQAVQALTADQLAGTGTTILEPTYASGPHPAVEVFQALGDACCSHTGKARDITIQGFRIKGRQTVYDGGVRSTVLLGNCEHCAVMDVYLEDTASIGVTAGGSALEFKSNDGKINKNNFARDIVFTRNIFSGVAAANTATINTEDAYVFHNYVRRPGHHNPRFGGGVCGHDHETNSAADHTRNIYVYNNLYDYEGAHQDAAGNAICLQDPYAGPNSGRVVAANNVIIGGRNDVLYRWMSNGMFLNGLKDCEILNNYIFRTGQNAIQIHGISNCLIQDNIFDSTGGGGNTTFWSKGMKDTIVRRNPYIRRDIPINMEAGFQEICGERNQYIDNTIPGVPGAAPPTRRCP